MDELRSLLIHMRRLSRLCLFRDGLCLKLSCIRRPTHIELRLQGGMPRSAGLLGGVNEFVDEKLLASRSRRCIARLPEYHILANRVSEGVHTSR